MITDILIIVLLAFLCFYPLLRKRFVNNKKQHFKNKLQEVSRMLYDAEYLKDEYKHIREGARAEYDRLRELQDAANVRISSEKQKEDPDKTIIEQMERLKERYAPDMEQFKQQMTQMDLLIEGPAPVEQKNKPINETLDNLRAVIANLKKIIKKL